MSLYTLFYVLAQLLVFGAAQKNTTSSQPKSSSQKNVTQCACGFRDPITQIPYTDSIIVYFNESTTTSSFTDVFAIGDFAHNKEQGWNTIFKVGALPDNVGIVSLPFSPHLTETHNSTKALELSIDPSDDFHLVNGANLETLRQDIQYGVFESSLQPASNKSAGMAVSIFTKFNTSESLQIDFMNMDKGSDARVSNLINGEWPSPATVTNFTTLTSPGHDPWNMFTTVRFSWTATDVEFIINNNRTRAVTSKQRSIPQAGQSLQLQSWSTGDDTYMEGPPTGNNAKGHVLFVRAFFNSSTWSADAHQQFDEKCRDVDVCFTDDYKLRGSTPFGLESTLPWQDPPNNQGIRKIAGIIAGCFSSFGIVALINALIRRMPWSKLNFAKRRAQKDKALRKAVRQSFHAGTDSISTLTSSEKPPTLPQLQTRFSSNPHSGIDTPLPIYGVHTPRSGSQTPAPAYDDFRRSDSQAGSRSESRAESLRALQRSVSRASANSPTDDAERSDSRASTEQERRGLDIIDEAPMMEAAFEKHYDIHGPAEHMLDNVAFEKSESVESGSTKATSFSEKGKRMSVTVSSVEEKPQQPQEVVTEESLPVVQKPAKAAPTKRIDYLAGLVAVACLGVTLHHWTQTFWPYITADYGPTAHYPGPERWISYIVGGYALTQLWIGPFFLTATRFLSTNYLKNGNLEDIAKKELRRAPRLFVPIIIISLLQFFLLSLGLGQPLQWLPSISWSSWPYVVPQPNFGAYINNIIELLYLSPNAVPEIITHYCIGVLWTVPVQLQYTYVVLGAAVLIRDIKTPWKRFGFYAFMIGCGWYARSWSACHWCGLVLSDLEATYKWRVYLKTRPVQYYAVVFGAFLCAAGAPLVAVFNQTWSFDTMENSIHPDHATGLTIADAQGPTYPDYFEPTLTIIFFSIGLQILVELSTWIQAFLSTKVILLLHPHIMTIYLTHGFVMWTWGAWVAIQLSDAGVPYWANLLVNLVTTYALIFLLASILSPLIEIPTQGALRLIDRWTGKNPVPKRGTTFPFTKELVLNRQEAESPKEA